MEETTDTEPKAAAPAAAPPASGEGWAQQPMLGVPEGPTRNFTVFVWKRRVAWLLGVILVFVALDQGTKHWAQTSLTRVVKERVRGQVDEAGKPLRVEAFKHDPKKTVEVIPKALSFIYRENPAAAFSLTRQFPPWFRRPFLLAVSAIAMLFFCWWYFLVRRPDGVLMSAIALVIAGAIGNFIDRAQLGYVVDFINAYAGFINPKWPAWPTFNIADSCIVVGAITVVYRTIWPLYPVDEDEDEPETEAAAA